MVAEGFKVGDRVRVKRDTKGFSYGYTGTITKIIDRSDEYKDCNIGVLFDEKYKADITPYFFSRNELEFLTAK